MRRAVASITAVAALVGAGIAVAVESKASPESRLDHAPATLRETGLYANGGGIAPGIHPYTPQYPLWSDGARKARWIYLPAGTRIDAHDSNAWQFPVGTRLWKQFSFGGKPVETRFMLRTSAGWEYATYVWNAAGTEAVRAPASGATSVEIAPGVRHHIPSEGECRACHANAATPVLGFSALQLSTDRDPNAPHREEPMPGSVDLASLDEAGLASGITDTAPRIAGNPVQRAALGYLHGNCGGCHRAEGAVASVGMVLAYPGAATTAIGIASHFHAPDLRIAPGDPDHSVVMLRMRSRNPLSQMPPLGTQLVDGEATQLIARWIDQLAQTNGEGEGR